MAATPYTPPYEHPAILRLTGISINDGIPSFDELAKAKFVEDILPDDFSPDEKHKNICSENKIPGTFSTGVPWIEQTDILCWYCIRRFMTVPLFAPKYIRELSDGNIEFGVLGNMCSFNCIKSWIDREFHGDARSTALNNLTQLIFLFTNRSITMIPSAVSPTQRSILGGPLSEEQYEKEMRKTLMVVTRIPNFDEIRNIISPRVAKIHATNSIWNQCAAVPLAVLATVQSPIQLTEEDVLNAFL